MRRRVVVTGLGAVSPIGLSVEESWKSALAGRSGIGTIDIYDPSPLRTHIAGLVPPFDVHDFVDPQHPFHSDNRRLRFGLAATQMALRDAAIAMDRLDPERVGIALGSNELQFDEHVIGGTLANVYNGEQFDEAAWVVELLAHETLPMRQLLQESHETVSYLSSQFGTQGPTASYLTACAAGAQAIGEGYRHDPPRCRRRVPLGRHRQHAHGVRRHRLHESRRPVAPNDEPNGQAGRSTSIGTGLCWARAPRFSSSNRSSTPGLGARESTPRSSDTVRASRTTI